MPLWVVHRIDRETSGVMVFARDADAHRALNLAFQHGQVGKTYHAYTAGAPTPAQGRIKVPMHSARKGKMRPAQPGEALAPDDPAVNPGGERGRRALRQDPGVPRPGTRPLADTALGVLGIELVSCDPRRVVARMTVDGSSAGPGVLLVLVVLRAWSQERLRVVAGALAAAWIIELLLGQLIVAQFTGEEARHLGLAGTYSMLAGLIVWLLALVASRADAVEPMSPVVHPYDHAGRGQAI